MAPQTRSKAQTASDNPNKGAMVKRLSSKRILPWIHSAEDWVEIETPEKEVRIVPKHWRSAPKRKAADGPLDAGKGSAAPLPRKMTARQRKIAQKATKTVAKEAVHEILEAVLESVEVEAPAMSTDDVDRRWFRLVGGDTEEDRGWGTGR